MTRKLFLAITGIFFTYVAIANNADLFTYNMDQINQELSQLQSLENYIAANPSVSLTQLQFENNSLISGLSLNTNFMGTCSTDDGEPLGISPFTWGCCLGILGIVIVFASMDDKDATRKAVRGCAVSTLSVGCIYLIYYIVYVLYYGGSWAYYY
jgi:hypothetical protein